MITNYSSLFNYFGIPLPSQTQFLSKHQGALHQWSLTTSELNTFVQSAPQFPVLCLRGRHDFVTEDMS